MHEDPTPLAQRLCGIGGCTLPTGHNMGRADVPENHRPPTSALFRLSIEDCHLIREALLRLGQATSQTFVAERVGRLADRFGEHLARS